MNIGKSRRKAYSSVISTILLSAVVLTIGGGVWAFAQGAMTVMAEDYIEGIYELRDTISERFTIEHVANTTTEIHVWIYNYGEVAIVVDVYVDIDEGESKSVKDVGVEPDNGVKVVIVFSAIQDNDKVTVKAVSRRGNNAYYRYLAQ